MKTIKPQHFLFIVLAFLGLSSKMTAQYQRYYSINDYNNNDTVLHCNDGFDRVFKSDDFEPDKDYWIINNFNDTILSDTLPIFGNYSADIYFVDDSKGEQKRILFLEYELSVTEDVHFVCSVETELEAKMKYSNSQSTYSYSWQPATGLNNPLIYNPLSITNSSIEYTVNVTTDDGCVLSDKVKLIEDKFVVDAGEDKILNCGTGIQLDSVVTNYIGGGELTYDWYPQEGLNDPSIPNPIAILEDSIYYRITVNAPGGCVGEAGVNVKLEVMDSPQICMVGVNEENKNIVIWEKPISTVVESFYIYRETNRTDEYDKIGTVSYNDESIFVDTLSNPDIQSNKYKITLIDTCGRETEYSAIHKTIHLLINQGQNNTWNLIWEPYEGFPVSTYYIYRGSNRDSMELIGSSSASNIQYSDFSAPEGYVYYQIEVISPQNCNTSKKAGSFSSSRSNFATNSPTEISNDDREMVLVYPNPASEVLNIELRAEAAGKAELFGMNGQLMKSLDLMGKHLKMGISEFDPGIYILRIITNGDIITKKLLIE